MQKRGLTDQQKRIIRENPHIQRGKLSKFLGVSKLSVDSYREYNNLKSWTYSGCGFPFLSFNTAGVCYRVQYKRSVIFFGSIKNALKVLDQLIWCIENNMFNKPRIEHPYLENLKFGV